MAHVVDEFIVLERYRVMILDRDASGYPDARYLINGILFDPVKLHKQAEKDPIPHNYIAVRSTSSFRGAAVEFIYYKEGEHV